MRLKSLRWDLEPTRIENCGYARRSFRIFAATKPRWLPTNAELRRPAKGARIPHDGEGWLGLPTHRRPWLHHEVIRYPTQETHPFRGSRAKRCIARSNRRCQEWRAADRLLLQSCRMGE